MKVLERLKFSVTSAARVVDVEKIFNGERPTIQQLEGLYKANVGNILIFNGEKYGKCLVKDYKDKRNYTMIYKDDKGYLLHAYVDGKSYEMQFNNQDITNIKKL